MKQIILLAALIILLLPIQFLVAQNTNLGTDAGNSGSSNTSIGGYAGNIVTGNENSFLGASAGRNNTSGYKNLFLGFASGWQHSTGSYNILAGWKTGFYNSSGIGNVMLGMMNGFNNNGSNNVFIGHCAGLENVGSGNVFLGSRAGYFELGSNKLFIDNYSDSIPLLYGEFDNNLVSINNRLGIGIKSFPTDISLMVNGKIKAKEVIISTDGFPDYVFQPEYNLMSLIDLELYLQENGHLPEVPSENEVLEEGINIGEFQKILLKKIEEQTLYLIELNNEIIKLKEENSALRCN